MEIKRLLCLVALASFLCSCNEVAEMTSYRLHRTYYMDRHHLHALQMNVQLDIPTSIRQHEQLPVVQDQVIEHYLDSSVVGEQPLKALDDYCLRRRTHYLAGSRNYCCRRDYAELPLDSTEQWQVTTCYCRRNLLILQRGQDYLPLDVKSGQRVFLDDLLENRLAIESQLHRRLPERFYIQDGRLVLLFDNDETGSLKLKSLRKYMRRDWKWLARW